MNTPLLDVWLETSTLQKAIRRNLPELALRSATRLWSVEPRRLVKRLAVVALEDIGLANTGLVGAYLAEALSPMPRERVMEYVAAFCTTPKSRYLIRIGATVEYHPVFQAITAKARQNQNALTDAMLEPDPLKAHAMATACRLSAIINALREDGFELLADMVKAGAKLDTYGLHIGLLATRHEKPVETITTDLPPVVMLCDFPSFTFDKHTRAGARALRQFVKLVPELSSLPFETAVWVAYRVAFRFESGLLDSEVLFTGDAEVERRWWQTLMVNGASMADVTRWRDAIRRSLPLMDECRRRVLANNR